MELKATDLTLNSLCAHYKLGLTVPDFQRGYSWTKDQVEQFWNDIKGLAEDKYSDHFIGPVVILKSDGRCQIVDGQQRLTTLVVLAAVIRDELINRYENPTTEYDDADEFIASKLKNLFVLPRDRGTFLDANYQIKNVLNNYVIKSPKNDDRRTFDDHWDQISIKEKRHSKHLVSAHRQLTHLMRKWLLDISPAAETHISSLEKLIDAIQDQLHFLAIEVGSEEDAFAIFETLNERGLKLSPADLLKSYLLRRILTENSSADRDAVSQSWDQITDNLEDYDVSNFLRHYLLTRHDEPIQKKVIFKKLRDEVEPAQGNRQVIPAHRILENIRWASQNYALLLNNRSVSADNPALDVLLRKLNMIGDSHRIFLLGVALHFQNDSGALLLAARNSEILLFRWVVCGKNAQVLENHFQTAARTLRENDLESLKSACRGLILECPSDEEFEMSLKQGNSRDTSLQAYAYRSICRGLTGSEVTTDRREVSVEHIAPRNPDGDYWFNEVAPKEIDLNGSSDSKVYEDYVYMWGNITILERPLNSSVRNGDWSVKKFGQGRYKGYSVSQIASTAHLMNIEKWNAEQIIKRNEWFVTQALNYWKKLYVEGNEYPSISDYGNS